MCDKYLLGNILGIKTIFQATPEEVVVIQKDTERLIEKATDENGESVISSMNFPERASYETQGADGKLLILSDAEIILPNAESLPGIDVKARVFTQAQVTSIFDYLFPNGDAKNDYGHIETKEQIRVSILQLQQQYADGEYPGSEEDFNNALAELEAAYATAPNSDPPNTISDGIMWNVADLDLMMLNAYNDNYSLRMQTSDPASIEAATSLIIHNNIWYSGNPTPIAANDPLPERVREGSIFLMTRRSQYAMNF